MRAAWAAAALLWAAQGASLAAALGTKFGASGHEAIEFSAFGAKRDEWVDGLNVKRPSYGQCPFPSKSENPLTDGPLFSEAERMAIYFGNWMRDFSQVVDPVLVPCLPGEKTEDCKSRISTFGADLDKKAEETLERLKEDPEDNAAQKLLKNLMRSIAEKYYDTVTGIARFIRVASRKRLSRTALTRLCAQLWGSKMAKMLEEKEKEGWYKEYVETSADRVPVFWKRNVLGADGLDHAIGKFTVDVKDHGLYFLSEHLDNPFSYKNATDKDQDFDEGCRSDPLHPEKRLDSDKAACPRTYIDPSTHMKRYFYEGQNYIFKQFQEIVHAGRSELQARKDGRLRDADLWKHEKLRRFGQALHVLEDFYAHSNFVELAIRRYMDHKYSRDKNMMGLRPTPWTASYKEAYPLVTGTFGPTDTLASLLGILDAQAMKSDKEKIPSVDRCVENKGEQLQLAEKASVILGLDLMWSMAEDPEESKAAWALDGLVDEVMPPFWDGTGQFSDNPPAVVAELSGEGSTTSPTPSQSTQSTSSRRKRTVQKSSRKKKQTSSLLEVAADVTEDTDTGRARPKPQTGGTGEPEEIERDLGEIDSPPSRSRKDGAATVIREGTWTLFGQDITVVEGPLEDMWHPLVRGVCIYQTASKKVKKFLDAVRKAVALMKKPFRMLKPNVRDVASWLGVFENWAHTIVWVNEQSTMGQIVEAVRFYQWITTSYLPEKPGEEDQEVRRKILEEYEKLQHWSELRTVSNVFSNPTHTQLAKDKETNVAHFLAREVASYAVRLLGEAFRRAELNEWRDDELPLVDLYRESEDGLPHEPVAPLEWVTAEETSSTTTKSSSSSFVQMREDPKGGGDQDEEEVVDEEEVDGEGVDTSSGPPSGFSYRSLGPGCAGDDVQALQRALNSWLEKRRHACGPEVLKNMADDELCLDILSYSDLAVPENGIYEEKTYVAVKMIQRAHGLPYEGIVDGYTWRLLVPLEQLMNNSPWYKSHKPPQELGPMSKLVVELMQHPIDMWPVDKEGPTDPKFACMFGLIERWVEDQLTLGRTDPAERTVYHRQTNGALEIMAAYDVEMNTRIKVVLSKIAEASEAAYEVARNFVMGVWDALKGVMETARRGLATVKRVLRKVTHPSEMALRAATTPCEKFTSLGARKMAEQFYLLLMEEETGLVQELRDSYFGWKNTQMKSDRAFRKGMGLQRIVQCVYQNKMEPRTSTRQQHMAEALLMGLALKNQKKLDLAISKEANEVYGRYVDAADLKTDGLPPIKDERKQSQLDEARIRLEMEGAAFIGREFPQTDQAAKWFKAETLLFLRKFMPHIGMTGLDADVWAYIHPVSKGKEKESPFPGYRCIDSEMLSWPASWHAELVESLLKGTQSTLSSKTKRNRLLAGDLLQCLSRQCDKLKEVLSILGNTGESSKKTSTSPLQKGVQRVRSIAARGSGALLRCDLLGETVNPRAVIGFAQDPNLRCEDLDRLQPTTRGKLLDRALRMRTKPRITAPFVEFMVCCSGKESRSLLTAASWKKEKLIQTLKQQFALHVRAAQLGGVALSITEAVTGDTSPLKDRWMRTSEYLEKGGMSVAASALAEACQEERAQILAQFAASS